MIINSIKFEFDAGLDPLTGVRRKPVQVFARPSDRYDLYYIGERAKGHSCEDLMCRDVVPVLAKPGDYILVSYDRKKVVILKSDDSPVRLLPMSDGSWIALDSAKITGGCASRMVLELDPSQDPYEILRRSRAARIEFHVPARQPFKNCDRLWGI